MEDCETGVLTEIGSRAEEEDEKLQGHRFDLSVVEVVRILYYSFVSESWKKLHVGDIDGYKLPAHASNDDTFATKTL